MKLTDEDIKINNQVVEMVNEFGNKFTSFLEPKNYKGREPLFVTIALSAPALISANIIIKLVRAMDADEEIILDCFLDKLKAAIEIRKDPKNYEAVN